MVAVYPNAIPNSTNVPDIGPNLGSGPHSTVHNNLRDEVFAALAQLGVVPSGSYSTVKARLDAGWQPIAAATVSAAASFTVSIPASTYKMVRIYIRGLNSDTAVQQFQCRVNNDSTAGLHEAMFTRVLANATVSGTTAVSGSLWQIGNISNVTSSIFDLQLFETDSSSLVPWQCVNTVYDPQLADARTMLSGGRLTANRLITSLLFSSAGVGTFTGNYVAQGYRV